MKKKTRTESGEKLVFVENGWFFASDKCDFCETRQSWLVESIGPDQNTSFVVNYLTSLMQSTGTKNKIRRYTVYLRFLCVRDESLAY